MNPILVDVLRGNAIESSHCGALAVLDADGGVVASLGDIDRPIFPRSAVKVLQALPLIAEANPQTGLLMESLMATVAQSDKEAKLRIRAFLDRKTAKVKPA